jgi:hypothetical protein
VCSTNSRMKDFTPAIVIGVLFFVYVRMFVHTMNIYKESDYTMTWGEFFDRSFSLSAIRETSS